MNDICKGQKGAAANHEPKLIKEIVQNCFLIRVYCCALCGELEETVIGSIQYPKPDKEEKL